MSSKTLLPGRPPDSQVKLLELHIVNETISAWWIDERYADTVTAGLAEEIERSLHEFLLIVRRRFLQ